MKLAQFRFKQLQKAIVSLFSSGQFNVDSIQFSKLNLVEFIVDVADIIIIQFNFFSSDAVKSDNITEY